MARSTKAKVAKSAEDTTIYATVSGSCDPAIVEADYARTIEGWADLPERTRKSIVERTVAANALPEPPRMEARTNGAGQQELGKPQGVVATDFALGLSETFGKSIDVANERLGEMSRWFMGGDNPRGTVGSLNAGLAFVHGCKPQSALEATLATQMVMTNSAAMRALNIADRNLLHPEHAQTLGNLAVKLLRTFTAQAEALAKIQRGGEQVVKHIHLDNRGGQAIVTDSVVTGGSHGKDATQPHEQGACGPALLGSDPAGYGVPITSDEREEALSYSRRS